MTSQEFVLNQLPSAIGYWDSRSMIAVAMAEGRNTDARRRQGSPQGAARSMRTRTRVAPRDARASPIGAAMPAPRARPARATPEATVPQREQRALAGPHRRVADPRDRPDFR